MKLVNGFALMLLLISAGCSSSKISTTWKAKNIGPRVFDKIMVIGIIGSADRSIQEKMETHIYNTDRTIRVALSIIIRAIGLYYQSWWGLLEFIPPTTSYLGFCPGYKMMSINSCNRNEC